MRAFPHPWRAGGAGHAPPRTRPVDEAVLLGPGRHPAVVPGGMVEFRKGSSGGGGAGCLLALGILVVILIIASQH